MNLSLTLNNLHAKANPKHVTGIDLECVYHIQHIIGLDYCYSADVLAVDCHYLLHLLSQQLNCDDGSEALTLQRPYSTSEMISKVIKNLLAFMFTAFSYCYCCCCFTLNLVYL